MGDRESKSLSTEELVRHAQSGDRSAFEALIERHDYRLSSLLYVRMGRRLGQRIELEDLLQEVWTRAYESLPRFEWRGGQSFFRWLGGIADNLIKHLSRHHFETGRAKEQPLADAGRLPERVAGDRFSRRDGTSPSTALRRDERFTRLSDALDRLSDDHREVIILARLRGLKIKEIAEQMGRTPQAVSCLLLRALRQLKVHFGDTESFGLPDRSLDGSTRPRDPSAAAERARPPQAEED
jgi:RNA polymerase sigma-70 factor (ECF subfamily)